MRFAVLPVCLLMLSAGCSAPSLLITPVSNTSTLDEVQVARGSGAFNSSKVAIIELDGMLANAKSGGLLQPTENKLSLFTQQLERASEDRDVKAIVLRINSPGGTVTCSDTMYDAVQRFKAATHKPVVASAQEVCASGAYYVACSSDVIVANPTSVVGSIGVILETLDVADAMGKLGISFDSIKSGPLKDMGSPFKHLDPQAREVMQGMVDEYYARFKGVVRGGRPNLVDADVKTATDGRVFSGMDAAKIGLVDKVGRLEDAIDIARQLAHAPGAKVVMYKRPYGYSGSIYATDDSPQPRANVMELALPQTDLFVPPGFYYLWQP